MYFTEGKIKERVFRGRIITRTLFSESDYNHSYENRVLAREEFLDFSRNVKIRKFWYISIFLKQEFHTAFYPTQIFYGVVACSIYKLCSVYAVKRGVTSVVQ